jgi:hypothetical protein
MRVEIRGMEEVQRLLRNLSEKEIQYATFVGTNRIAYAVMKAQREEVKTTFADPTRFIQTGIRYEKMTKTRRQARAYWTPERNPYIEPHVIGGARAVKKFCHVCHLRLWGKRSLNRCDPHITKNHVMLIWIVIILIIQRMIGTAHE